MLELFHLKVIRAVQQRGTLTLAAEELHLTQSALSHAVKKLEQQLGTAIWLREGRTLRLTAAGRYLLSVAERIVPQMQQAEQTVQDMAEGSRGNLRVGMECHPCYQWLLKVVGPFLKQWPDVDIDVKQQFQFGGVGALYNHEIDLLVTPDPINSNGLEFTPVFGYEQKLALASQHALASKSFIEPQDLTRETLITYPVEASRLDIYSQFLLPAGCAPRVQKHIETTEIMLQMVAAQRGVAALPGWLIEQFQSSFDIVAKPLGKKGVPKRIFLGVRKSDAGIDYLASFIQSANSLQHP
ncbi:LysR family transcriptional regulator [Halioxenophilus aromaticivorans]|uniref:HTH-type transcriptional regulator MetR n=1 Tax=Halioxenophilus aromaticivorans TaxID=1306992 RepID=A0AAV3TX94_9ALTE